MRRIRVYEWGYIEAEGDVPRHRGKIFDGEGIFHRWGSNYEEMDTGCGNYSTAIVEMADGTVRNIEAELIEFVEPLYKAFYGGDKDVGNK